MRRIVTIALLVAAGAALGLGCQPTPTGSLAALEGRVSKLEGDLKAAEKARDAATAQARAVEVKLRNTEVMLQGLEVKHRELDGRFAVLTAAKLAADKERQTLAATLATRTAEREQLAGQLDGFGKDLRALLGRVETASAAASANPAVVFPPAMTAR